jgi:hypothetical protein
MSKKRLKEGSGKKKSKGVSRKKAVRPIRSKKVPVAMILAMGIVMGSYFLYNKYNRPTISNIHAENGTSSEDTRALRGGENRATLKPFLFRGRVAKAYSIAQESRELLDSIYCYCHCKRNFGHKSLLTCFVDRHASECDICQDQAIFASSHFQDGFSIRQVREAVDQKFWRPFS